MLALVVAIVAGLCMAGARVMTGVAVITIFVNLSIFMPGIRQQRREAGLPVGWWLETAGWWLFFTIAFLIVGYILGYGLRVLFRKLRQKLA